MYHQKMPCKSPVDTVAVVSINVPSDLTISTIQATSHNDDMMKRIESLLDNSTPRIHKIENDIKKNDGLINKLFTININR